MTGDLAWYQDVKALARRPSEFFPTTIQTAEERLNAIVRLIAYGSLAAYLVGGKNVYIAYGAVLIAGISVIFRFGRTRGRGGRNKNAGGCMMDDSMYGPSETYTRSEPYSNLVPEHVQRATIRCSPSTPSNPFSNATVGALLADPSRPPACSYDSQATTIRTNFNKGLFRNLDDVYEVENSQRQFVTQPVTTSAPDTGAFAQFLYGSRGQTCKESTKACRPWFAVRD